MNYEQKIHLAFHNKTRNKNLKKNNETKWIWKRMFEVVLHKNLCKRILQLEKKLLGEASLSGIKSRQFNKTSKFHYGNSKCFGNTA